MIPISSLRWLSLMIAFTFSADCLAQTIPPNPLVPKGSVKSSERNMGGSIGGVSVGLPDRKIEKKTIVVNYHAVSPLRQWTNSKGKKITARLLAYSVPRPGTTGAAEVLRDGKILFLIPGQPKPVEYPKDQLVDDDQIEIERIVEAASFTKMPSIEEEEKDKKAAEDSEEMATADAEKE